MWEEEVESYFLHPSGPPSKVARNSSLNNTTQEVMQSSYVVYVLIQTAMLCRYPEKEVGHTERDPFAYIADHFSFC